MGRINLICILLLSICMHVRSQPRITNGYNDVYKQNIIETKRELHQYRLTKAGSSQVDFLRIYAKFCHIAPAAKFGGYTIKQSCWLSTNRDINKSLYYEWIYFENPETLKNVITAIRDNNCVEAFNIKIQRIYHIGPNSIICVNYASFKLQDFETYLKHEFPGVQVDVINH